jgi:hypothetical protein
VQLPSEAVTTVRPSALDVDMLVDLRPAAPFALEAVEPMVVVEPETLPPPAVTCERILPAVVDDDRPGGFSLGFRCTVLQ